MQEQLNGHFLYRQIGFMPGAKRASFSLPGHFHGGMASGNSYSFRMGRSTAMAKWARLEAPSSS